MQIYPEQVDAAYQLIKANPDITFIVGHLCMPKSRTAEYFKNWQNSVAKLGSLDNVYMKLSGFGMFEPGWTAESIKPFIDAAISAFGVNRCMFASNYPVDKLYKSYDDIFDSYLTAVHNYSQDEIKQLFQTNAELAYRI